MSVVVFVRSEPSSDGGDDTFGFDTIGSELGGVGGDTNCSEYSGDDTVDSEFGGVGGGVSGIFVVFKL